MVLLKIEECGVKKVVGISSACQRILRSLTLYNSSSEKAKKNLELEMSKFHK